MTSSKVQGRLKKMKIKLSFSRLKTLTRNKNQASCRHWTSLDWQVHQRKEEEKLTKAQARCMRVSQTQSFLINQEYLKKILLRPPFQKLRCYEIVEIQQRATMSQKLGWVNLGSLHLLETRCSTIHSGSLKYGKKNLNAEIEGWIVKYNLSSIKLTNVQD